MKVTRAKDNRFVISPLDKPDYQVKGLDELFKALNEHGYNDETIEDAYACLMNMQHDIIHLGLVNKSFLFTEKIKKQIMQWKIGQRVLYRHNYHWHPEPAGQNLLNNYQVYIITSVINGCWEDNICHVCKRASDKQHYLYVNGSGPHCGSNFIKAEPLSHMPSWF